MTQSTPLFCTRQEMLESLRLGSSKDGSPIQALLDDAIMSAAVGLRRRIPAETIESLRTAAQAPAPSTDAQIRRTAILLAEKGLVRHYLLDNDSALMREGSPGYLQAWNREGFVRAPSAEERNAMLSSIARAIERNIEVVLSTTIEGPPSKFRAESISSGDTYKPFSSIGWV